jgi:sugar lactone lactonase YvrE
MPTTLHRVSRSTLALAAAVLLGVVAAAPTGGSPAAAPAGAGHRGLFPTTIDLPDGAQPEGIAIGILPFAYVSSLTDGDIYRANLITGRGRVISEGPGTPSVGLELDRRGRLFVAGGPAGDGRVIDAFTGEVLASYQFAAGNSFVNDVIVTPDAAWFTDSLNPVLYRVPFGRFGTLPDAGAVTALPLTGDLVFQTGFNVNGITRTPDGKGLLVVQSNTGRLFRVDPASGDTTEVDLGTESVPNGDGMLLEGRTLFVVQNQLNQVAVVRLDRSASEGTVVERLTDPRFDVPTTIASFANRLYLPNARFGVEPTPTTPYTVVAIPRP